MFRKQYPHNQSRSILPYCMCFGISKRRKKVKICMTFPAFGEYVFFFECMGTMMHGNNLFVFLLFICMMLWMRYVHELIFHLIFFYFSTINTSIESFNFRSFYLWFWHDFSFWTKSLLFFFLICYLIHAELEFYE